MRGPQHAGRRNASWSGLDMEPQEIANLVVGQFEIGREKAGTPVLSPRFSGFSLTEGLILVLKPQQGDSAGVRVTEAPRPLSDSLGRIGSDVTRCDVRTAVVRQFESEG